MTNVRRSARLAALRQNAMATLVPPLRRSPRLAGLSPSAPLGTVTVKRPRRCLRASPPSTTQEEFDQFNDSLSEEDKEIQANLLMWCISRGVPYTVGLFHQYKDTIQRVRNSGLF
jgi:hypothetical protein